MKWSLIDPKSPEFLAFAAQAKRNLDDHWAAWQKEEAMTDPVSTAASPDHVYVVVWYLLLGGQQAHKLAPGQTEDDAREWAKSNVPHGCIWHIGYVTA